MGAISRRALVPVPEETVASVKRLIELVAKTPDDVLRIAGTTSAELEAAPAMMPIAN